MQGKVQDKRRAIQFTRITQKLYLSADPRPSTSNHTDNSKCRWCNLSEEKLNQIFNCGEEPIYIIPINNLTKLCKIDRVKLTVMANRIESFINNVVQSGITYNHGIQLLRDISHNCGYSI